MSRVCRSLFRIAFVFAAVISLTTVGLVPSVGAQEDEGPDLSFSRQRGDGWVYVNIEDFETEHAAAEMLRVSNDLEFQAAMFDVDVDDVEIQPLTSTQLRMIRADQGYMVVIDETPGYYGCLMFVFSNGETAYWVQHSGDDMSQRGLEQYARTVVAYGFDVPPPSGYEIEES